MNRVSRAGCEKSSQGASLAITFLQDLTVFSLAVSHQCVRIHRRIALPLQGENARNFEQCLQTKDSRLIGNNRDYLLL